MNARQRAMLAVGLGLFVLVALCPPFVWYRGSRAGESATRVGLPGTRAWLWAPPTRGSGPVFAQVNREQLAIELMVVVVVTIGACVLMGTDRRPREFP